VPIEDEKISLREYVISKIDSLKELMEQRFAAMEEAKELQAEEYKRRLDALNNEYKRHDEVLDASVTKELYSSEMGNIEQRVRDLEHKESMREGAATNTAVYIGYAMALIGWIIAIIGILR
jgi:hypothetical protein